MTRNAIIASLALALAALPALAEKRYLQSDENGVYNPSNAVMTSEQFTRMRTAYAKATNDAARVEKRTAESMETVDKTVASLVGQTAVSYVDGFVESIFGDILVDEDNAYRATIFGFVVGGAGEKTIPVEGVPTVFSGHQVYFAYPENVAEAIAPDIRYEYNLGGTNMWLYATQDEPVGPSTIIWQGIQHENAYLSVVWMPKALNQCFFRVFTQILAGATGLEFHIYGGIRNYPTATLRIREPTDIFISGGLVTNWVQLAHYDEPWDFAGASLPEMFPDCGFDVLPVKDGDDYHVAVVKYDADDQMEVIGYHSAPNDEGEMTPLVYPSRLETQDAIMGATWLKVKGVVEEIEYFDLFREGLNPEDYLFSKPLKANARKVALTADLRAKGVEPFSRPADRTVTTCDITPTAKGVSE